MAERKQKNEPNADAIYKSLQEGFRRRLEQQENLSRQEKITQLEQSIPQVEHLDLEALGLQDYLTEDSLTDVYLTEDSLLPDSQEQDYEQIQPQLPDEEPAQVQEHEEVQEQLAEEETGQERSAPEIATVQYNLPRRRAPGRDEAPQPVFAEKRKRKIPRFYKVLLTFAGTILALIIIGASFFWSYMEAYEASLPEPIVAEILANIDYDFWQSKVKQSLLPLLTEFERENQDAVLAPYLSMVTDVSYTIRQKRDESTDTMLVYILRAGARDIGVIRLTTAQSAGYGFSEWEVGSIEYLGAFTDGFAGSVFITASRNADVSINGIAVSEDYIVPCDVEYGTSYYIENIFGDVQVAVTEWDGSESEPYFAEGGEFLYSVIRPFSMNFDIIAPNGTDIYIGDEKVTADSITEGRIVPAILEGYLEPSQVTAYSVRYQLQIDELYSEPEVTSADTQGRDIIRNDAENGQIIFSLAYDEELKEQHEATVEAFIRAYITYNANIGDNAQANFAELARYMVSGSDLYNRAYASLAGGAIWMGGDSITYNSLEIDNFMPYGDRYFTCQVRYNISNRTLYETREVVGDFEIIFVLTDGRWLAARMINI